jgi:hypothetical protein
MSDENTAPETVDLSALDDTALHAAYSAARERGQELAKKSPEQFSAEEVTEFDSLATSVAEYSAEITARQAKADAFAAKRDSFSSLPELSAPVAPAAPVAAPVAPVQAAPAPVVPSVSELASQAPVVPTSVQKSGEFGSIVTAHVAPSAAGLVNKQSGEAYEGTSEISMAFIKNAQQFGRQGGAGTKQPIVQFKRNRGAEFTIDNDRDGDLTMRVLRHARDEKRLHGGSLAAQWQHNIDSGVSLTAAAGWCAPSQNDYDLCRNWSAGVGLLDLPTVTVTRGGINYTDEPTFPQIYANAVAAGGGSNFLTEAQVIADTIKTCSEIPCPTFEDRRLDVMALCIRVSFLQAAGYPEVVNAWQDGLLAAHEQEMNRLILADILARAGAATVLPSVDPDGDDSFTSALLAAVELAREDLMYTFMMAWGSTIEVILPHWVLPQIRADLSRRSGDTGNLLGVTDSQIAALFSARGVRVQFVRGWQDGLVTGGALNPAFPGGDATTPFMTALPTTVSFLAFPAGSVAVARQDVVTLTNVYDAASLATNEFTSLFAEEGFAPVYPCPGQRLYTVSGCPGGITGAHVIDCTDATP